MYTDLTKKLKMVSQEAWTTHFIAMVKGKLPHQKVYTVKEIVDKQKGSGGDIKLISPTQAAVDQAKSAIKRKLEENFPIKTKKMRKHQQSGVGSRRVNKTNKKKSSKKAINQKYYKRKQKKSSYKKKK